MESGANAQQLKEDIMRIVKQLPEWKSHTVSRVLASPDTAPHLHPGAAEQWWRNHIDALPEDQLQQTVGKMNVLLREALLFERETLREQNLRHTVQT